MTYELVYSDDALDALEKMDSKTSGMIMSWIEKNLYGCENPRRTGKDLKGRFAGMWRYRVGDYRIFALIKDNELIIVLVDIRHRRNAYS